MGSAVVTSYDIARRAGVSQSTVSRALRDDARIAAETRQRIREIATELNYVPNLPARNLITGRTSAVGVIVADLLNPVYPQLVQSIQGALSDRGYRTILLSDETEGRRERDIDALRGGLVAGIIFVQARTDSTMAQEIAESGIPLVILGRDVIGGRPVVADRVLTDSHGGARLAAEHLHGLGHRRIGMINGPTNNPSTLVRETLFRARLEELGAPADESLSRRGPISHATGLAMGRELLELDEPPTAVFCCTDYVAFGLMDAAFRLGVPIPQRLSVLGYDNLEMASWSMFDLTTVEQPFREEAHHAVDVLVGRIESERIEPPQRKIFPVHLVQRGSTAQPPGAPRR